MQLRAAKSDKTNVSTVSPTLNGCVHFLVLSHLSSKKQNLELSNHMIRNALNS